MTSTMNPSMVLDRSCFVIAESLLKNTKSMALIYKPVNEEEDCAGQDPKVTSSGDDHGSELEINHPQHDAGNVQPETVSNVPPKPAAGPASYRSATLRLFFLVMMRTAVRSTIPMVSRCVLGRTLAAARSKLLGLRGTSPTSGW